MLQSLSVIESLAEGSRPHVLVLLWVWLRHSLVIAGHHRGVLLHRVVPRNHLLVDADARLSQPIVEHGVLWRRSVEHR